MTSRPDDTLPDRSQAAHDRGYTLVEVMVVLVITIVGFLAMTHLQASVLRANENSWNAAGAVELARHLQETIRMEGLEWTNDTQNLVGGVNQAKFVYLKNVGGPVAGQGSGWLDAGYYPANTSFALVNQLGYQTAYDSGAHQAFPPDRNRRYCVRYRLTWVVPNFLIRSDVRVLWVRHEGKAGDYDTCPGPEGDDSMERHPQDVFTVSFPATVMKNVFVAP
jgi:prepilin-type N-terminal cleavage/methylation domain-containing protein